MNRRQLLSLAVIPFVPKVLKAVAPADKPKNYPLFIQGYGNQVSNGLVFLVDTGKHKIDFNISKLLAKIFPHNSYGNIRVEYMNLQNQEALVSYIKFAQIAKYCISYSTEEKTLALVMSNDGEVVLSRYNEDGLRIN